MSTLATKTALDLTGSYTSVRDYPKRWLSLEGFSGEALIDLTNVVFIDTSYVNGNATLWNGEKTGDHRFVSLGGPVTITFRKNSSTGEIVKEHTLSYGQITELRKTATHLYVSASAPTYANDGSKDYIEHYSDYVWDENRSPTAKITYEIIGDLPVEHDGVKITDLFYVYDDETKRIF